MNQLAFLSKEKTVLAGFMLLGIICLALSVFAEPAAIADAHYSYRFWTNFLHNTVFFTGIGFMALFIFCGFMIAYAGWYVTFKRVWEAIMLMIVPGLALLGIIIVGMWLHWHELYHWMDAAAVSDDRILAHKSFFLNKNWYTFGTIIIVGLWAVFAFKMRSMSRDEDREDGNRYLTHRNMKVWGAIFLPIAGFSSCAVIWQWIMSIDAHWYSTMFAWYTTASWFVALIALTILLLIYLKSRGYYQNVTDEHLHDLGKFLFAFSIFWTYLWFSQYMLIWYANNGEETAYFFERYENYPVLFYGNLAINFVLPFIILMANTTKRKYGTLVFTSIIVFFGHWWDFFLMIKPGTYLTALEVAEHHGAGHAETGAHAGDHAGEHAGGVEHGLEQMAGHLEEIHGGGHGFVEGFTVPGLLEIGIFLGFLAMFLYLIMHNLTKAPLVAKNDPYLNESLHHHV